MDGILLSVCLLQEHDNLGLYMFFYFQYWLLLKFMKFLKESLEFETMLEKDFVLSPRFSFPYEDMPTKVKGRLLLLSFFFSSVLEWRVS